MYKSKRSKATSITIDVKRKVYDRDNGQCICCGRPGTPNAHYIRRSQGGLGVEQNIVTLCAVCHHNYDNGNLRKEIGEHIEKYLKSKYPGWNEQKLIYNKWDI